MFIKRLAYRIVFKDLSKNSLFMGRYDAKHGQRDFMYGIGTVMENIADAIDENTYNAFQDIWLTNLIESEERNV